MDLLKVKNELEDQIENLAEDKTSLEDANEYLKNVIKDL